MNPIVFVIRSQLLQAISCIVTAVLIFIATISQFVIVVISTFVIIDKVVHNIAQYLRHVSEAVTKVLT